jgi:hypothetical protein
MGCASTINGKRFKAVLEEFMSASGGNINRQKSQIYIWNTNARTIATIARILQFPLMNKWKYFRYLGILIYLNSLPSFAWTHIMENIKDKFN